MLLFKCFYIFSVCDALKTVKNSKPSATIVTLFRMGGAGGRGGGAKKAPYQFFPVTSINVGISPQIFLTFSFNPKGKRLPNWSRISKSYLVPVPNYWTWMKTIPLKRWFFWWNPYKVEVMITSVIEMLELPDFCHMTTSTI